ncbi:MAG: urea transporter [Bacillariaceae sp.]|jgi:urea transporter
MVFLDTMVRTLYHTAADCFDIYLFCFSFSILPSYQCECFLFLLFMLLGCLVGCAAAVFGSPSITAATTATIIGAAATPFVAVSLKETMGSVPQWTFAFNIVALTSLLRTRPLLVAPSSPDIVDEGIMTGVVVESSTTVSASSSSFITDIITSPLTGISQIFVVQSTLSGAIIVGGIGSYSPLLAVHAVGGSAIGTLVGATSGAPLADLTMGLYGFNSALTSMAVGVFFVHSTPAMLLSAGGAAATASLFGAMSTVFGVYGSPCLTLPFCLTMSSCYLLHRQVPGLLLASNPHSPEKNKVD